MFVLKQQITNYTYDGNTTNNERVMGIDVNQSNLRDRFNRWGERLQTINEFGRQVHMRNFELSCSHPGRTNGEYASIHIEYIIEHMNQFDEDN